MNNLKNDVKRIWLFTLFFIFLMSINNSWAAMLTYSIDDGHHSAYDIALPILTSYNQVATVNMISSYVGKKYWLTEQQLLTLQNNSWEICSHSVAHPHFSKIPQTYEDANLNNWSLAEGEYTYAATYSHEELPLMYENGGLLSKVNNISQVESRPGSFFYDKTDNIVYLHTTDNSSPDTKLIQVDSVQAELELSKKQLQNMGLNVQNFIVPYHDWTEDREYLAQIYYNSVGAGPEKPYLNATPLQDKYDLIRLVVPHDKTIDALQWWVNKAIEEDAWLILCFHYFGEDDGLGEKMYWSSDKLESFASWVQGQDINVVTQQEGILLANVPINSSWIMLISGLIILGYLRIQNMQANLWKISGINCLVKKRTGFISVRI